MLTAAVIHLQALQGATLKSATGRGVHGFWFRHWKQVDPDTADGLHAERQTPPYTLSPLMGLPRPTAKGITPIPLGAEAWFRVTTLTEPLSESLLGKWIPGLSPGMEIEVPPAVHKNGGEVPGIRWRVSGVSLTSEEHPWAGQTSYSKMTRQHLMNSRPPAHWRLRFATPTTFHGSPGHLPFPLPASLIGSWLRRWQAYAPLAMPDEFADLLRAHLVVSAYQLKTIPVREGKRLTVGCVGSMSIRALKLHPAMRAALDLLAHYAFYTGSGHRTTQGMGVTGLKHIVRREKHP